MATRYAEILALIADRRLRRPAKALPALDTLFRRLAVSPPAEALHTEDRIWDMWMHHPHREAAAALELATRDIAARRYDIAETRLTILLRRAPGFAEAWLNLGTALFALGRTEESRQCWRSALEKKPTLSTQFVFSAIPRQQR